LDVRIFYKECQTLAAAGYDVHLIVKSPPSFQSEGVSFHEIEVTTNQRWLKLWQRLKSAYQQAVSLQADIYHFHDTELILVGLLLKLKGFKVIYDVHEDAPQEAISLNKHRPLEGRLKSFFWILLEGVAKQTLDAFVCVTPTIAQKFPQDKTIIVQNFPLMKELQLLSDINSNYMTRNNVVIYVGGISLIRGIKEMVTALEILPSRLDSKMILLGEFSSLKLETEVTQILGWKKVDFRGWQSRDLTIQTLSEAKLALVLFHPEIDHLDALPNKLFEYMAAGLPVVASDFPLWRSIIEQTGCGLLVNPLEPQAIAHAIQYLLEHPSEAEAMGKRGQEAIKTQYNWDNEAKKLLTLYQDLEKI
jgi:glycosyltransferase involved in cell wall biosynthesis